MKKRNKGRGLAKQPLWYKDAVIYELHVRAFFDSNGDGIGDFNGLVQKLDYLSDLGITAIWLLPFYPSPLRDDGYDIAHYTQVHPDYGTLADFKALLREAHARGIRVITELVVNHTSREHPWFKRAQRAAPGSKEREFYVWSDSPDRYTEARIIFQDFETSNWAWDPIAKAYFWHRFYSHQPDLNFDNPDVHRALFKVVDFWLGMGVDGMRLDAVPYLYERDGTNCENLPETHEFLRQLRAYIDSRYEDRMLLAEANQWPADAAAYFGDGDECQMNFHFPLMPRMFMAVQLEDRFPIVDILNQTPAIPEVCQWATFLRNHDELTLEMVTDEDRDYMWRMYAEDSQARINLGIRRRLAPLLKTRSKVELLNSLLFTLPGTPVLYYGDEIGMGDNIYLGDRNGVRTPFQWSADRNAGFSRANPQKLFLPVVIDPEYHFEATNVETQQSNPTSLLWWMRRLIALRKAHKAFGRGSIEVLHPANKKILAFLRVADDESILVVANLSRYSQHVELDLGRYRGHVPEELFGRSRFPTVGDRPYPLSLTPHGVFWFLLRPAETDGGSGAELPEFEVRASWRELLDERRGEFERILVGVLPRQRWFRAKTRRVRATSVIDVVDVESDAAIVLVRVDFYEGEEHLYQLPITATWDEAADDLLQAQPGAAIGRLFRRVDESRGVLQHAASSRDFGRAVLGAVLRGRTLRGRNGQIVGQCSRSPVEKNVERDLEPRVGSAEQTNTSILYGDRFILKLVRRLELGANPDVELVRLLNQKGFAHVPELVGTLDYRGGRREAACVAIVQRLVPGRGDAWQLTLEMLDRFYEAALARTADDAPAPPPGGAGLVGSARDELPLVAEELLGQRTAEMHLALATDAIDPELAPERFSELHQRSLYQSARTRLAATLDQLRQAMPTLAEDLASRAAAIIERRADIDQRLAAIAERKLHALRIRCHGDYHLGQVLYTGQDFVIIDFEGEPARSLGERRLKRSPLRDVAGMLRSFHYAAVSGLQARSADDELESKLQPWAESWTAWVSSAYLGAYLETAAGSAILPEADDDSELLLQFCLLEKCVYELGYELDHRPDWLAVPLAGLESCLGPAGGGGAGC